MKWAFRCSWKHSAKPVRFWHCTDITIPGAGPCGIVIGTLQASVQAALAALMVAAFEPRAIF